MSADNKVVIKVIVERQVKAVNRALLNGLIESTTADPIIEATRRTVNDVHNKELIVFPSSETGVPMHGRRIRYAATRENWGPFDQFDLFQHLGIFPAPDQS